MRDLNKSRVCDVILPYGMFYNPYVILLEKEGDTPVVSIRLGHELAKRYRASLIWSYDGRRWIKNTGGRAIPTERLKFLSREDIEDIMAWLGVEQ